MVCRRRFQVEQSGSRGYPDNSALVSVASLWEMGIKISLGKLDIGMPFDEFVRGEITGNGMDLLGITAAHVERIIQMPFHHRDPFDRLLIAQAEEEDIPIVGCDHGLTAYGATLIW